MRITWIDNLRWLGILLIVAGHSFFPIWSLFVKYLFSFHVILFFFLSWLLFNENKHTDFIKFIKTKFNRLIIPFVFFNLIMFTFFKLKSYLWDYEYNLWILQFIKWIFYWSYLPEHPSFILANVPTWFLVSLFVVSIYYFFINKFIKNKYNKLIFLFLLSVFIYSESKYITFRFPFNLEISLFSVLFYWLWNIFKKEILKFVDKINYKYLFLIPLLVFLNIYFLTWINISTNYYWDNYFIMLLNWFLGVSTFVIISKLIPKNFILDLLWKNSIIVLGMEWIKFLVLSFIIKYSFWLLVFEESYLNAIVQIIWTIIAIIPIIFIINKYFPFIIWSWKKVK